MANLSASPHQKREWFYGPLLILILALVPPIAYALGEPFIVKVATRVVIFAIVAVGLDLIVGFGGLVSLCHAGLFGAGGYVVAILAYHQFNSESLNLGLFSTLGTSDLLITLPLAALVASILALIIGAISLRTSGAYFIMITLAFNQMMYYLAVALQKYGGEDGLQILNTITLGGMDVSNRYRFFYLALVFLILTYALINRLASSRFGIVLRAAATNETRVIAVGILPWSYRLVAFVITGCIAGIAGALLAAGQQFISPADMSWDRSGDYVVMAVLGGIATVWGPILGAAAFIVLELVLSSWTQHWHLAFGLLILAVVIGLRGGLADLRHVFSKGEKA